MPHLSCKDGEQRFRERQWELSRHKTREAQLLSVLCCPPARHTPSQQCLSCPQNRQSPLVLPARAPAAVPLPACETANLNLALACFQEQQPQSDHTVHTKSFLSSFFFFSTFKAALAVISKAYRQCGAFKNPLDSRIKKLTVLGHLLRAGKVFLNKGLGPLKAFCYCGSYSWMASNWFHNTEIDPTPHGI